MNYSTRLTVGILLVALMMLGIVNKVEAQTWQDGYYASSGLLPSASTPAWDSITNGSISVVGTGSSAYFQQTGGNYINNPGGVGTNAWNFTAPDSTLEFNMAVQSVGTGVWAQSMDFSPYANFGVFFYIESNGYVVLQSQQGPLVQQYVQETTSFLSQMNTYRLTFQNTGGGAGTELVDVYLNNNTTPLLSATFASGDTTEVPNDAMEIGATSGNNSASEINDFQDIQWTNAGAFAPGSVPEPSTIAFVLLSLFGLLFRQRAKLLSRAV